MYNILIVDDEQVIRNSFSRVLTDDGYNVSVAENGVTALEKIKHEVFDIALLDLKIGDIDGLEIASFLHKTQPNTRIIIITGYGTAEVEKLATDIGVSNFVSKPISPDDLISLVKTDVISKTIDKIVESKVTVIPLIDVSSVVQPVANISHLVLGSILGLFYVVFLPIVGLAMLGYLIGVKFLGKKQVV